MFALCLRMLGNRPDAEDATQQSLVLAVRSLSRFDGRSSFGTWMYRIATNTCLDEIRRRRRRPLLAFEPPGGSGGDGARESHGARGSHDVDPADPGDVAAARVDVAVALGTLQVEFRAAVVLRDLCDLSYEEIATILGVPVGTVRSRIARGRAALADFMSESGNRAEASGVQSQTSGRR